MKKVLSLLLTLAIVAAAVLTLASCGKKKVAAKIGVIRGDASSVEALAWEKYLKDLSDEMGVKIDFTTAIDSADQELQAVQNYGSQGYNGVIVMTAYNPTTILEKCQEYKMYMVVGAAHPDFEDSDNSLVKDPNVVIGDFKNYPYYVGATGPSNYGEVLAGYEMGKSGVAAGFTKYSVFTGATAYGQMMHALRIAGWFAALHDDDPSVTYNGVACTLANWKTITAQLQKDLAPPFPNSRATSIRSSRRRAVTPSCRVTPPRKRPSRTSPPPQACSACLPPAPPTPSPTSSLPGRPSSISVTTRSARRLRPCSKTAN